MENNFDCLLLASGGMDSTVLAYKLAKENKNVVILFIDYGQHCKDKDSAHLLLLHSRLPSTERFRKVRLRLFRDPW